MIAIVDYGMGNLGSIRNMFSRIGVESLVTSDPAQIEKSDKLVLPGVGAFDLAMTNLAQLGLIDVLNEKVLAQGTPVLGICLGMQLLTKRSEEGELPGLGWVDAQTIRFQFAQDGAKYRLPHIGWNTLDVEKQSALLGDQGSGSRFYFVHSYHVRCEDQSAVLATSTYAGVRFHSALVHRNVMGTQFHPEKSHKYGMQLLDNFARMAR